jgi:hypothetical protein
LFNLYLNMLAMYMFLCGIMKSVNMMVKNA